MNVLPNTDLPMPWPPMITGQTCCLISGNWIVHAMNFFSQSICASLSRVRRPNSRSSAVTHLLMRSAD